MLAVSDNMFVHNNSKHGRRARRLDPSEGRAVLSGGTEPGRQMTFFTNFPGLNLELMSLSRSGECPQDCVDFKMKL